MERISGPSTGSDPGEAGERQHRGLDTDELGALVGQLELVQARARGQPDGRVDEVDAGRLAHERHRPAMRGVDFDHADLTTDQCELDVQQADDAERRPGGDAADLGVRVVVQRGRRNDAGGVAGVDPRFFDVFHHGADVHGDTVAERVDVDLERALEEAVDKDEPDTPAIAARTCASS